ncbi:MAG: glycosyltransferase [Cetobacterium sp.]|uniref:glycosyltransferase n=1 Tax=Cetobacterium sp. TaxID=2071632 RepID=UPI003F3D179E
MKKIVNIIVGLGNGGAEMMLYKLLETVDTKKNEFIVISMTDKGVMGERIESLGIKLYTLEMKKGIPTFKGLIKAISICKKTDIIQSWMYHADLLAFIVSIFVKPKKIIWGIRRSNLEKNKNKKLTLIIAKLNSILSRYIDTIVTCSIKAKEEHIKFGYKEEKIIVIPNGFSVKRYHFIEKAQEEIRNELKIDKDKKILSLVGRWEKLKDHKNCLNALEILSKKRNDFVLLLCGTEINKENKELMDLIENRNLNNFVYLLDRRDDIPKIMSATDIYISSSSGEGFSNVIGEAMACETICVVTDVGDSSYIIGDSGFVVPRENPERLASEIEKIFNLSEDKKNQLKKIARERIIEKFEITNVVKEYSKLYR